MNNNDSKRYKSLNILETYYENMEEKEVMWKCIRCENIEYRFDKPEFCPNCKAHISDLVKLEDSDVEEEED